jgi:hypothetical protein
VLRLVTAQRSDEVVDLTVIDLCHDNLQRFAADAF